ncbi:hypothetical protein BH23PLA1_BH23PLA1_14410 [soil metagenome]
MAVGFAMESPRVLHAGQAEIAKLKAEYPAARERLEQAYSRVRASGRLGKSLAALESGAWNEVRIDIVDGRRKAVMQARRATAPGVYDPYHEYVYCVGRETMFEADRDLPDGGPYTLSDVGRRTPEGATSGDGAIVSKFDESAGKYIFAPFRMHGWDDFDWFDEKSHEITSAEAIRRDGEGVLRFEYRSKPGEAGSLPVSGRVEVLPGRSWVVRRHELNGATRPVGLPNVHGKPYTIVLEVEYGGDRDGIPVPARVQYSGTFGESIFAFDEIEFGATAPEREFTPEFYRLPDITALAPDPARSYTMYWLFGLATMALATAIILKKRAA